MHYWNIHQSLYANGEDDCSDVLMSFMQHADAHANQMFNKVIFKTNKKHYGRDHCLS